jgi:hypothetical protein
VSGKWMHPDSEEAKEAEANRRKEAIEIERRRWWELRESAERCVGIAEAIWTARLDAAQVTQQKLAEEMRDRDTEQSPEWEEYREAILSGDPHRIALCGERYKRYLIAGGTLPARGAGGIPVPLFTPRDRLQFLKEFATTLLISADRRNLPVTREAKRAEQEAPSEAASGDGETITDAEIETLAEAAERGEIG